MRFAHNLKSLRSCPIKTRAGAIILTLVRGFAENVFLGVNVCVFPLVMAVHLCRRRIRVVALQVNGGAVYVGVVV